MRRRAASCRDFCSASRRVGPRARIVTGWRRHLASRRAGAFTTWANVVAALVSRLPTPATLGLAAVRVDGVEFVPMTPVGRSSASPRRRRARSARRFAHARRGRRRRLGARRPRGARRPVLNGPRPARLARQAAHRPAAPPRGASAPPDAGVVRGSRVPPSLETPAVVKPRLGSWGRAVTLCTDDAELAAESRGSRTSPGTSSRRARPGARAARRPRPAAARRPRPCRRVRSGASRRPGEWRTNVSLGARREPAVAPPAAIRMALDAARALDAKLVGVDLLPTEDGWTIVELNGAVEFTREYGLGRRVPRGGARARGEPPADRAARRGRSSASRRLQASPARTLATLGHGSAA